MRPTVISYLVFLVSIITINLALDVAAASEHFVYDDTGKKVLNNVPYYIGPLYWGVGGGDVKLTDHTKNKNKVCPYYVVQDRPASINPGGKFSFILSAKQKYLLTSHVLGIHSGLPSGSCDMSTFWQISDPEAKAPSNLITTGGAFESELSCFQVVDYPKPTSAKEHSYMLQHCPSLCGAGPQTCFNVSVYEDNGVRYLASTGGTPFEFEFKKAK